MLRHLWALSSKSDSLWVKLIHAFVIKDRNLWYMPFPQDSSWILRKLFKLKALCQSLIKYAVGDGFNTFLWLTSLGPHSISDLGKMW